MENIDRNADILTILDGYKSYAEEYEERKKKEEEDQKRKHAEEKKIIEENLKRKSIQDEIAETLQKIKKQEEEDAKKFLEEKRIREEKKRREEAMKAKIEEELNKIKQFEKEQFDQIQKQNALKEQEIRKRQEREKEELKRKKEQEAKLQLEQKKFEEVERKRLLAEMQELKAQKAREEARKFAKEQEKKKHEEELRMKKLAEKEEKLRQKAIEDEKKRLWAIEKEKEREEVEKERMRRIEADRKIAADIMARKQAEEDERTRLKKEAEDLRMIKIEHDKKKSLEDKKKSILQNFQKKESSESPLEVERPRKKIISNPFAQKFENLAKTSKEEDEDFKRSLAKNKKILRKSRSALNRSKQLLSKMSQDNLRKSQNLFKKLSTESVKKGSLSKGSRMNLNKNSSQKCLHAKIQQENPTELNKQQMQDYLISQVLFDGKEDVKSSRMAITRNQKLEEQKIKEMIQEEENKKKEIEMVRKEYELKKQIETEMAEIKKKEEENKLKAKEAEFEAYKKEMEKYLNFVCVDKEEDKQQQNKKIKRRSIAEPKQKLSLNIGSIKDQFEKETVNNESTSPVKSPTSVKVNKLDKNIFARNNSIEEAGKKKKEYVPVIIDKDAFERTKCAFEKEKREEEERQNQIRIKERQRQMEEEKERLIKEKQERERLLQEKLRIEAVEKERKEADERKRNERERKRKEEEEEKIKIEEFKRKQLEEYETNKERNIYDQIKNELAKIKEEDEKMKEKIEKERKKKSLLQQIQNEISRIKKKDVTDDNADEGIDDETPDWLKKVINSKNKELASQNDDSQHKPNHQYITNHNESNIDDLQETPAWIKIFQERSEKLHNAQSCPSKTQMVAKKGNNELEENKEATEIVQEKQSQRIYIPCGLDYETAISQNEAIVQKSVKDLKNQLETAKHKPKEDRPSQKKSDKTVIDRVRKVKSMLLDVDRGKKDDSKSDKKTDISKDKAKKIKTLFETSVKEEEKAAIKPKKPRRKYIRTINNEIDIQPERKSIEKKDWKWKQKSVSELYNYINSNKKHIPESITNITDDNRIKTGRQESGQQDELVDSLEFESYIESIHDFIGQVDNDDTESCFKDTLKAYLSLIEDDSKERRKKPKVTEKKSVVLSNTLGLKNKLEESIQKDITIQKKDVLIGKVDTAFLSKAEETKEFPKQSVTRDITKSIVSKFETIGAQEEPRELYSMKRKLITCKPDVDTSSWKKKQVEYQWKYKQNNIDQLTKFIQENKKEDNLNSSIDDKKSYTSIFKHIDFSQKVLDEEKKMKEFEQFMEEVHDFLESETVDEEESALKWGIHAYIELIEDSEKKDDVSVSNPKITKTEETVPKLKDIKAKLENKSDVDNHKNSKEVGKLDVSSFLSSLGDSEGNNETESTVIYNKDVNVINKKALFESSRDEETIKERTIVKKKLITLNNENEKTNEEVPKVQYDWKYKKKDIQELQQFISRNKDIASKELLIANDKIHSRDESPDTSALLSNSAYLVSQIKDRDDEFEKFMCELNDYMNDKSDTMEQEAVKDNIRHYLDMIDTSTSKSKHEKLPSIGSAIKVKEIRDNLTSNKMKELTSTQVNTNLIGKVSHFFKKNTNEKVNSNVIKENITSLLEPGKAKIMKANLEKKPKLKRSLSFVDMPKTKLNKDLFERETQKESLVPSLHALKERQSNWSFNYAKEEKDSLKVESPPSKEPFKPIKSQWDTFTDPEEKKKAILAKHGLKYIQRKERDGDIDEILNYESKDDMKAYERELKQRYFLCEADDSSMDSSPELDRRKNKEGSHSSLLNILNVMKKATKKSTFNETKSKVLEFGKSSFSKSDVDISDINKSCTDVIGLFERGEVSQQENRKSNVFEDEEMAQINIHEKKTMWENNLRSSSSIQKSSSRSDFKAESIGRYKEMFECEDDREDKRPSIQEELEELRQSSKLKSMFRIEKGNTETPSSLRRTNSCIGVSGERLTEDLDEEVMAELSVSNKMVKAMFEQNAPKYKFGGSGSNLSINGSKEDLSKKGPVKRPSVKPKEDRKWVLDSINKYFDVIVEEEEEPHDEDEDEEYEDELSDEYDSEDDEFSESSNDEDIEGFENTEDNNYQSTSKMRGLLSSVVNKISGSVGNLAQRDLMNSLKQNLGSQINLRSSNSNLLNN